MLRLWRTFKCNLCLQSQAQLGVCGIYQCEMRDSEKDNVCVTDMQELFI